MEQKQKKTIGAALLAWLRDLIPVAQDPPREWARKLAFLMAFIVFIGAGWYLLDDMWVQPQQTEAGIDTLRDWYYTSDGGDTVLPDKEQTEVQFPVGMLPQYQPLYRSNPEIRGWVRFTAGEGEEDLFEGAIDNPIVQTVDNDYYLDHDFWGRRDKAGTLYFDYRNDLSDGAVNRNLILYGHNLKSGLMFSKFNLLVSGKVERAQKLTTLTLNTLYDERVYKVFAVMVLDADEEETTFSALRTQFSGEPDFLRYVQQIRDRSLYHFGDVDVAEGDEILTMLTCSNKRDTTLVEGRTVIVARRVREGEDPAVDPLKTTLNEQVLMPKQWYVNKKLPLPETYTKSTTPPPVQTVISAVATTTTTEATTSSSAETSTTESTTVSTETTTTTEAATTTTTTTGVTTMTTTTTTTTTTTATTTTTTTTITTTATTAASVVPPTETTTAPTETVASVVVP